MKSLKHLSFGLLILSSLNAMADVKISHSKPKKAKFRKYTEKINFNYGLQYLGPSLSNDYQDGATYNRFNSGQDWKNDENDPTGPYQLYHSIGLGYHLTNNMKVSYSYTFQDELKKDIRYKSKNLDGTYSEYTRAKGVSDNNKRLNLFVSNMFTNKHVGLSTNFFYEFPSTVSSQGEDMEYGIGIQPNMSINNSIAGLNTGVTSSIQRNYFKKQEYFLRCGDQDCKYPTKYQTLKANIGGYANYSLNDYVQLQSSIEFDWDQKGDEVDSTEIYNKNMDDIAKLGAQFNIDYGITAGTFIQFAIEEMDARKSAIGANLNVTLY